MSRVRCTGRWEEPRAAASAYLARHCRIRIRHCANVPCLRWRNSAAPKRWRRCVARSSTPRARAVSRRARARRMGIADAIPLLIEQVLVGAHDVEAADALADLADDPAIARQIVERFEAAISDGAADAQTRGRICQALAEIDDTASALLERLAADPDPAVARTARYVIGIRNPFRRQVSA